MVLNAFSDLRDDLSVACDKGSLLIVDDEVSIAKLFKVMLSSAFPSLKIDLAGNGAEAVQFFGEKHYCLLLMDLHMPIMDGRIAFGEIQKLCESREWEMPAVVFCTGFAPPESVKNIVATDAKHFLLSKPVTGQKLVDTIKSRL